MCQLCARSGCWGLWKLLLWFQVRDEQVERVARCVSSCAPLLFFLPALLPSFLSSSVVLCGAAGGAGAPPLVGQACVWRVLSWFRAGGSAVSCSVVCSVVCVLCHRVCSVCDPPLLQIYNRVCGPGECVRPENLQGSTSSQNYFCHTRWESV